MKDYPYAPGWRLNKNSNKPAINHSILMLTTHGVAEGEWDGNEWIQYRWSCKLKDSDVLYWIHLEDLTRLEKEGENLQQEQPEVDLEKEFEKYMSSKGENGFFLNRAGFTNPKTAYKLACHFYELGLNARKKN